MLDITAHLCSRASKGVYLTPQHTLVPEDHDILNCPDSRQTAVYKEEIQLFVTLKDGGGMVYWSNLHAIHCVIILLCCFGLLTGAIGGEVYLGHCGKRG